MLVCEDRLADSYYFYTTPTTQLYSHKMRIVLHSAKSAEWSYHRGVARLVRYQVLKDSLATSLAVRL